VIARLSSTATDTSTMQKETRGMTASRPRTAFAALALALGALLALAGPASAKVIHEQEGSFPLSHLNFVGIDNSTGPNSGNLYIGELNLNTFVSRVYQTDDEGTPTGVELNGSETPAGFFNFVNLATSSLASGPVVDGSPGGNAGKIYVPDVANGVVDRFNEDGSYDCQITGKATPSVSECAGAAGSETPSGALEPLSVGVHPGNGNVAIGDASGAVSVFNEAGEYLSQIIAPQVFAPFSMAFDSAGNLYVVNANPFTVGAGSAVKFGPGGGFEYQLASSRFSVGVDLNNDHVYLGGETDTEIEEFDSSGNPISTFSKDGAVSIDVNQDTSQLYVSVVRTPGIHIWSGDIFVPNVTTGEATDVDETATTLNGEVDPEASKGGSDITSCEFEHGETTAYGDSSPCAPSTPYSDVTGVSAGLTGLAPSTTYHYRLIAENEEGRIGEGDDRTFTTLGPASIGGEFSIARTNKATVKAQVNPFGFETTCEVLYVDDASYQASGYATAGAAPCAGALAAGFGEQPVSATLHGLDIGTTYHYRFVAHNDAVSQDGTTVGADQEFSTFGIESFSIELLDEKGEPYLNESGEPYIPAGGHPYEMRVDIKFTTTTAERAATEKSVVANPRTIQVNLPPGLIGNPTATTKCQSYEMVATECPASARVGRLQPGTSSGGFTSAGDVYNLVPPIGIAAQLGSFINAFGTVRIDAGVRTGADYGIETRVLSVPADIGLGRVIMSVWGVVAPRPFLTNPTACTGLLKATVSVDAWQEPGNFASRDATMPAVEGCDALHFRPKIAAQPTVRTSESPTGLHVNLHVPQNQNPIGLAEANLKDAMVRLPAGVAINPSGANGLDVCSAAQIGYKPGTSGPAEFTPGAARCPDGSKIGRVEVNTPLLEHQLKGGVYVAKPYDNPFDSLLAIYIAIDDPKSGVVMKLPGHVVADPDTGRLTTTFSDNPQLPFEDFTLNFFGGAGAALVTPETCGNFNTTTDLRPWSENGDKHPQSSFAIDSGPNGSACANTLAEKPNQQGFTAGTINPAAGDDSPFVLRLSREDGSQRLSRIDTVLPSGLVGKLAGVAYCPEGAIAAAAGRQGSAELASPSCPAASRVGSVNVGAGAGPRPYFTQGSAYLAGPYKGAPISLAVITPAVAGPFELGNPTVRIALHVDPVTARITAKSDPLPQILEGIPLNLRSINFRTDITRNPTSCAEMSVGGTAFSVLNQAASLSDRFQVGGCRGLGLKPRLHMRLFGGTKRGDHPRLRAVLMPRRGDANIGRAVVTMPRSTFLDQSNIRTICTRVQWAQDNCPKAARYGRAVAHSPLLDQPLRGPVYLRSSNNKLPDLVADLRGPAHQPIRVELPGRIDSVRGGIRTTFAAVPDAPVSKFVLHMKGGKRQGLIVNSRNLCERTYRAAARFKGHNGRIQDLRPALRNRCPGQ
jgi:hypothetical protein